MPATGMCGGVFKPVAFVPLWQLEQLVSVAAWVYVPPDQLAKLVAALAWQVLQSLPLVGGWFAYDAVPSAPVVPWLVYEPLWHVAQVKELTVPWPVVPIV